MPYIEGKNGYKHHWEEIPEYRKTNEHYFQIALIMARFSRAVAKKYKHHRISENEGLYFILNFLDRQEFYTDNKGQQVMRFILSELEIEQTTYDVQKRILDSANPNPLDLL